MFPGALLMGVSESSVMSSTVTSELRLTIRRTRGGRRFVVGNGAVFARFFSAGITTTLFLGVVGWIVDCKAATRDCVVATSYNGPEIAALCPVCGSDGSGNADVWGVNGSVESGSVMPCRATRPLSPHKGHAVVVL